MIKCHFVIDKTHKNKKFKNIFFTKYKNYLARLSNVIVVLGGDGFMLQTLKKLYKFNKPFYGVNSGNYGFLMNKFSNKNFSRNLKNSKPILIHPLQMTVKNKKNQIKKSIAINEVSILRQSRQAASLKIVNGKNIIIKKLISDGVMVSTPAGSTAYNLSVHGPILSLNSRKLAVTPISSFRPRRWKGKVVSDASLIKIKNLNVLKRPISVVADNIEARNIKSVIIKIKNSIKFKLLYDKDNSLIKKIKIEQLKKEIN